MQIYSRTGATAISAEPDPIIPDENGAFEVSEELGNHLVSFHGPEGPLFESGAQRNDRLEQEAAEAKNSPAALHDLLAEFLGKVAESKPAPEAKAEKPETAAAKKKREAAEAKAEKEATDAAAKEAEAAGDGGDEGSKESDGK